MKEKKNPYFCCRKKGVATPYQALHIVNGNILISRTSSKGTGTVSASSDDQSRSSDSTGMMRAPGSTNGSIYFGTDVTAECPSGVWGIEYDDAATVIILKSSKYLTL